MRRASRRRRTSAGRIHGASWPSVCLLWIQVCRSIDQGYSRASMGLARLRYRGDRAGVSTWILAIARNVAIDYFRRTRVELPIDDTHVARDETPETAAVRRSDLRRLGTLLGGLPPRERDLLALKFGAGATNRAIAKLTGLSESNVGTILHRTIAGLRAAWDAGGR